MLLGETAREQLGGEKLQLKEGPKEEEGAWTPPPPPRAGSRGGTRCPAPAESHVLRRTRDAGDVPTHSHWDSLPHGRGRGRNPR